MESYFSKSQVKTKHITCLDGDIMKTLTMQAHYEQLTDHSSFVAHLLICI